MPSIPVHYVPPKPLIGYNQSVIEQNIDAFYQAARRKKKILAYSPVKDVTVVIYYEKKIAIVKWLPRQSDLIMLGSGSLDLETDNGFGRHTFGSFELDNNNGSANKIIFAPEAEFDIYNFEIADISVEDFNNHVNQFSEIFRIAGDSPYLEYPYCMIMVGGTGSNVLNPDVEPEKSYLTVLNEAHKNILLTGSYDEPSSNIIFVKEWMKLQLRSLFNTARFLFTFAFPSDHPDGTQLVSHTSFLSFNAIYRKDIIHYKLAGLNPAFYTFSITTFLDTLAKHANKDPTGAAGGTLSFSAIQGGTISFTVPGVPEITTGIFKIGGIAGIEIEAVQDENYSFTAIDVEVEINDITGVVTADISYGVYTYQGTLWLSDTFLYYTLIGYDLNDLSPSIANTAFPPPGGRVTNPPNFYLTANGGVGQTQSVDIEFGTSGGGAFQDSSIFTTASGFYHNYSTLTEVGVYAFGSSPSEVGLRESHSNSTLVLRFATPSTFVSSFSSHNLRSHLFGNLVTWSYSISTHNINGDSFSSSHPLPPVVDENARLNIQYSMDGRTLFHTEVGGNDDVYVIEGIVSDPFLMSFTPPIENRIGDFVLALTSDAGNNWDPPITSGQNVSTQSGAENYSPDGAGWTTYTNNNSISYTGPNGQTFLATDVRLGSNANTVGMIGNSAFGGVNISGTGSVQLDIHLVDNDLKRTGIFSMLLTSSAIFNLQTVLDNFLDNQYAIISGAEELVDPDYKAYIKAGDFTEAFIPAEDENGDYLYEPSITYQDLLLETFAARVLLDDLFAQIVVRNDFMSYELLGIWMDFTTGNAPDGSFPLASYIMHTNTLEIPSVNFQTEVE